MAFHEQSIAFIAAYSETRSGMIYVFHAQPAGSATSSEQWAVHQILMPTDMNNQMNAYGQSISIRALSITNASLQASGSEEIMNTSETRSASSLRSDATSTKHQYASNGATKNITYNYLVAVVGSPGDQAMGVESGAIYIYASLQSATVNNTEVFYSSEAMAWQLLGKVTGNDTETMSSYGHSVLCNAHGTILVSAILANTPISQQSGAVYVEHSLAPYLIAEEYQHDPDGEEASSGGSSSCSWGQFFRRWMTSTGSIVGLACLPAAFFVLFVLMQTHKDEIHDYFFRSKSTIDSAKYGQVNESSTSDLVRHPLEIDTSSANTDSHISPLEQVLRALLARQSSVLGDNSAREHAGIVSRVVHSFRSMWMRGERRDDPILPSDPSSATSSCHGEGFRDDPVQDDVEDKASNPLIIGTGSSSLPAMAMETEARKRDLLDRMHRIVNSGVNPMSAPSRRRRRSESLSPQVEEEHGDDDGEGKSEAIQV